jgi:hypothetical protein
VSSYFLGNYCRLNPAGGGLTSTEAMVIIQLMDHKWDERAPYPTVRTLAKRMGLSVRAVRSALENLQKMGYLQREPSSVGGPNRYHLEGLFKGHGRREDACQTRGATVVDRCSYRQGSFMSVGCPFR